MRRSGKHSFSSRVKLQLMSTAQILEEIKSYPTDELETLEHELRLERLRRTRCGLSARETQLFEIINEPLPGGEHLLELRAKREAGALSPDELETLIQLDDEREEVWARKLKAVTELADYRGVAFDDLYRQLELNLCTDAA